MTLASGVKLGPDEVLSSLGAGGMGDPPSLLRSYGVTSGDR